jgi:hypothetical protein
MKRLCGKLAGDPVTAPPAARRPARCPGAVTGPATGTASWTRRRFRPRAATSTAGAVTAAAPWPSPAARRLSDLDLHHVVTSMFMHSGIAHVLADALPERGGQNGIERRRPLIAWPALTFGMSITPADPTRR